MGQSKLRANDRSTAAEPQVPSLPSSSLPSPPLLTANPDTASKPAHEFLNYLLNKLFEEIQFDKHHKPAIRDCGTSPCSQTHVDGDDNGHHDVYHNDDDDRDSDFNDHACCSMPRKHSISFSIH